MIDRRHVDHARAGRLIDHLARLGAVDGGHHLVAHTGRARDHRALDRLHQRGQRHLAQAGGLVQLVAGDGLQLGRHRHAARGFSAHQHLRVDGLVGGGHDHAFGAGGLHFDAALDGAVGRGHLDHAHAGRLLGHVAVHVLVFGRDAHFTHPGVGCQRAVDLHVRLAGHGGSAHQRLAAGRGDQFAAGVELVAQRPRALEIDLLPVHAVVDGRHRHHALHGLAHHDLLGDVLVFGRHGDVGGGGRGLEHLALHRLVLRRHFDQAPDVVFQLAVVGRRGADVDDAQRRAAGGRRHQAAAGHVVALELARRIDHEAAQRHHLDGLADPGAAAPPFAVGLADLDLLGDDLVRGRHLGLAHRGRAHLDRLDHRAHDGRQRLDAGGGFGAQALLGHRPHRQAHRQVLHDLGPHQHALDLGAVARRHGFGAGGGGVDQHGFFHLLEHRRHHTLDGVLGHVDDARRLGAVDRRQHLDALCRLARHELIGVGLEGRRHRLVAHAGRAHHHVLGHADDFGRHRDLAARFRLHQHLLGHRLVGGGHHFLAPRGGGHQHLLGAGFKARRVQDVGKALVGQRRRRHGRGHDGHRRHRARQVA